MKNKLGWMLNKAKHPAVVVVLFWIVVVSFVTFAVYNPIAAIVSLLSLVGLIALSGVSWLVWEAAQIFLDKDNC